MRRPRLERIPSVCLPPSCLTWRHIARRCAGRHSCASAMLAHVRILPCASAAPFSASHSNRSFAVPHAARCFLRAQRTAAATQPAHVARADGRARCAAVATATAATIDTTCSSRTRGGQFSDVTSLRARFNWHRAAQCARRCSGSGSLRTRHSHSSIFVMHYTALNLQCAALRCLSVSPRCDPPTAVRRCVPRRAAASFRVPST